MGLPQREGRPSLDLSPDETPSTAGWADHYDNVGANELNEPVPVHKGKLPANGWLTVAADVVPEAESFGPGSKGSEKR